MEKIEKYCDKLKEKIEELFGGRPLSHSDYIRMSEMINEKENSDISHTTLKRMWGYIKNEHPTPQPRTLNILSKFVGFKNWDDFCESLENADDYSSEFVRSNTLRCFLLQPGEKVQISWYPQRRIVIEHEGDGDLFRVVESKNSKLKAGMQLHCDAITMHNTLCLRGITGDNINEPCDYVCGKIGGVTYEVLK